MSYATQAATYREMEVLSASPGQLVVILYDHLLVTLRRARTTMDVANPELRGALLEKGRLVLCELLSTLDQERGGQVAGHLASLYTFFITELMDLGIRPDAARLARVTAMVAELRDGFALAAGLAPIQDAS